VCVCVCVCVYIHIYRVYIYRYKASDAMREQIKRDRDAHRAAVNSAVNTTMKAAQVRLNTKRMAACEWYCERGGGPTC